MRVVDLVCRGLVRIAPSLVRINAMMFCAVGLCLGYALCQIGLVGIFMATILAGMYFCWWRIASENGL